MYFKQYDNINYTATRERYKGVLYNMDKNCNFAKLCYAKALNGVKNGDVTNAIPELNMSLEMDRANTDALNLLGFCHYMLCDFEVAVGVWKSSLSIKPNDNKATMYMNIVESSEFKTIMKQYESGMAYFEQKDYKNAAFKMTNIISKKKELVKPYILAGISMASMGDFEEGISYIERGLQKDRGNIEAKKYINLFREKDFLPKQVSEKTSRISNSQDIENAKRGKVPKIGIAALAVALLLVAAFTFRSGHLKGSDEAIQTDSAEGKIEKLKNEHFEPKQTGEPAKGETAGAMTEQSDETRDDSTGVDKPIEEQHVKENEIPVEPGKIEREDETVYAPIKNEGVAYSNARKLYKRGQYADAAAAFDDIANRGLERNYKSESMFFAAMSYEKIDDFENAIRQYRRYADNYKEKSYYDESMYNMGFIFYEKGDIQSAAEVFKELKNEKPNSMYVNSKIKRIISLQKNSQ